ncbi:hypothetical protein GCM10011494_35400 [Novosphingobium endophyticum]|uniref:DUF4440 domain-containing protein n=1 Tax=Novosphingobium endophyticum TaxID=1955250 RepID=A0A916TV24_9SPHN|nr:nuclear transport factor 2 family protein [Novosphingobium endophyticum]GGC13481.1 hypothetical protein GCM10011494_35400 [Novosphingobium endophyticum]
MNKIVTALSRRGALASLGVVCAGSMVGAASATGNPPTGQTSLENAVEGLRTAMLTGDTEALGALLHDRLDYMHASGRSQTKRQVIDQLGGKNFFAGLGFSDAAYEIVGNVGIVKVTVDQDKNLAGGETRKSRIVTLLTWIHDSRGWKLLARSSAIIESPLFPPCSPARPAA